MANRRSGARRMYAKPAAAPQPAANASGRPGCQPPSGLSAASATAAARLPTMIPMAGGHQPDASRPTIQSASAAMAGPAKQNSSTKPTRSAGPASWAMKNSGLPRRTSKSGCATAMHQRLAMCSAVRRHPILDCLVETPSALIGIESKRFEPYRSKPASRLSDAYWRLFLLLDRDREATRALFELIKNQPGY